MASTTRPADRTLADIAEGIRAIVEAGLSAEETADAVADELRRRRPPVELLSPEQRRGRADRYEQHVLHVEPNGSFSIVGLVWRPGQATPIHDHVSWCVVAVLAGVEHEVIYQPQAGEQRVVAVTTATNPAGTVCGFAPPGDIHLVRNGGNEIAVSLHVYGADIGELGSSIRRCYPA